MHSWFMQRPTGRALAALTVALSSALPGVAAAMSTPMTVAQAPRARSGRTAGRGPWVQARPLWTQP